MRSVSCPVRAKGLGRPTAPRQAGPEFGKLHNAPHLVLRLAAPFVVRVHKRPLNVLERLNLAALRFRMLYFEAPLDRARVRGGVRAKTGVQPVATTVGKAGRFCTGPAPPKTPPTAASQQQPSQRPQGRPAEPPPPRPAPRSPCVAAGAPHRGSAAGSSPLAAPPPSQPGSGTQNGTRWRGVVVCLRSRLGFACVICRCLLQVLGCGSNGWAHDSRLAGRHVMSTPGVARQPKAQPFKTSEPTPAPAPRPPYAIERQVFVVGVGQLLELLHKLCRRAPAHKLVDLRVAQRFGALHDHV